MNRFIMDQSKAQNFALWIAELDNKRYNQGRGYLGFQNELSNGQIYFTLNGNKDAQILISSNGKSAQWHGAQGVERNAFQSHPSNPSQKEQKAVKIPRKVEALKIKNWTDALTWYNMGYSLGTPDTFNYNNMLRNLINIPYFKRKFENTVKYLKMRSYNSTSSSFNSFADGKQLYNALITNQGQIVIHSKYSQTWTSKRAKVNTKTENEYKRGLKGVIQEHHRVEAEAKKEEDEQFEFEAEPDPLTTEEQQRLARDLRKQAAKHQKQPMTNKERKDLDATMKKQKNGTDMLRAAQFQRIPEVGQIIDGFWIKKQQLETKRGQIRIEIWLESMGKEKYNSKRGARTFTRRGNTFITARAKYKALRNNKAYVERSKSNEYKWVERSQRR